MRDATASESPEDWETLEAWFAVTSNINEKDIEIDDIEDFDATIISFFLLKPIQWAFWIPNRVNFDLCIWLLKNVSNNFSFAAFVQAQWNWEVKNVYQNESSEHSLFVSYVDAINLSGGVMQNDKFPQLDFTVKADITLAEILNYSDDNPVG